MPANFKTYEAQARLLAAVIAAHPDLKLNYKAIAKHYGNSQTASAIEHRFRPLRSAGEALRVMVEKKLDADLLEDIFAKNVIDIAEHFGESTADGIQFQFRSVKANAETLKNAVKNNESPVEAFGKVAGGGKAAPSATPGGRKRPRAPATPTSRAAPNTNGSGTGTRTKSVRRKAVTPKYKEENSEDDDSSPRDDSELDQSPTKQTKKFQPITIPDGVPELSILTPTESVDDDVMVIKEEVASNQNKTAAYAAPVQQTAAGFTQSYFPTQGQAQFGSFTGHNHFQSASQHHQAQKAHGVTTHGSFGGGHNNNNNDLWSLGGNQTTAAKNDTAQSLGDWEADDANDFINHEAYTSFGEATYQPGDC